MSQSCKAVSSSWRAWWWFGPRVMVALAALAVLALGAPTLVALPGHDTTVDAQAKQPAATEQAERDQPEADDAADAEDDERILTGRAPVTSLGGGEPEKEEIATYWRRFVNAPSTINRDGAAVGGNNNPCGNGGPFEWRLAWNEVGRNSRVQTGELTFPSAVAYGTEANRTVHATVFKPVPRDEDNNDKQGSEEVEGDDATTATPNPRKPAVVLLHHLEDDQRLERLVANYFAMNGHVAVLLYFPHYGPRGADGRPDDSEMLQELLGADFPSFAQAVWDVHRVRDWLRSQYFVDHDEISLMGISLGGLVGSLSAGIDPGFSRYVLVLAGGDLARIIFNDSNETQGLLQQVREEGLTEEDLRRRVRPVDPCTFAHRIDASRVLMFNTKEDEVIPRDSTDALIEAMSGEPTVHWYPGNHTAVRGRFAELLSLSHEFIRGDADDDAEEDE